MVPAAGQDPLAHYLAMLSRTPLFTPEEERNRAKELEDLETAAWNLVTRSRRATQLLALQLGGVEEPFTSHVLKLARAYGKKGKRRSSEQKQIDRLARSLAVKLRRYDADKETLDAIVQCLRTDVRGHGHREGAYSVTKEEVRAIAQARAIAMQARNKFVQANLRLVVSVARRFHHHRIAFIDLIQEGNVGLMKAVHRFDYKRGFRFSTYAHWWIRQSIERAIMNKASQVRLPVHIVDSRRQIRRAETKLNHDLGRKPTYEEISMEVEMTPERVEELSGISQDTMSLDESVGDDDSRSFVEMVTQTDQPEIDVEVSVAQTHARIRELMTRLSPIEKDIILRRFGLHNDDDQTLDEIGKVYNLSRERVRQIQAQGLMKMRRMCERRSISPTYLAS